MSHILVAYATKHGATAEIAEAIAEELRRAGHAVDYLRADEVERLDSYDAAVIGSAVYMKRWRAEAKRLLRHASKAFAERPVWIFSSGPFGENPDPSWSEPPGIVRRAERLGVREHVVFGGRMPLKPCNFIERSIVEKTPPEHRDLRDWDQIRRWASAIGAELASDAGRPAAHAP